MHRIFSTRTFAVIGAALVASFAASAQAQGQAQNNSLFGANSATYGNNGIQPGAMSSGQSAGGGLTLPSNALPNTALPGSTATGANRQTSQTGFVGQQNTAFVGNQQARSNQTGMNNQFNNRQGQNRNNRGNQRGGNQNNQTGTAAGSQQSRTIRPQLHVSIDYTKPSVTNATSNLAASFDKIPSHDALKGVTFEADGSTIILRGSVDSDETRRLASALVRLEPGVRSVRNELTIGKPGPAPMPQ
ncbi:MAG: BON domain-containing protein [Planctomycetia bacterium]|nr:BON domain-containing protein [Planctomycetia bacterium]